MSITAALRPTTRPRWITPYDASRCYLLPDTVECNIPRRGAAGECGAWDWARGHLVELHFRLGGAPAALYYRDLVAPHPHDALGVAPHLPVGVEVTARLRTREDRLVTVVSRVESAPHGPRGDHWQVTVDGEIPTDADDPALHGEHRYPPSLPFLAFLVDLHLQRTSPRPTAPAITLRNHPA
ncbi:hypothetical protein [Saccharothrix syringae]|uniref:Uncharacterized protein n=1 Tax=Saccharothrix syringae TaxID=103733 RepID=A0A5Q0H480_SACSY|nr:hypothetical protein [Saccharothrix syringae]QFZ20532.1 hypothetical protein EKG83_26780 [Saccharothrix syringae]